MVNAAFPLVPVEAPALIEPAVSLLRAARDPLAAGDPTDGRWRGGFTYQSANSTPTTGLTRASCDETSYFHPNNPPPANNAGVQEWVPYTVWGYDSCSTLGIRGHDFQGRAKAHLLVARHYSIEREFWAGDLAQRGGLPNQWLTNVPAGHIVTGARTIARAVQVLEQMIADSGIGQGMIHLRPDALPNVQNVRRDGNLLKTTNDNIVVAGNGYPNTAPGGAAAAAGTTWLYATSMVDVRLDPDIVTVPDFSDPNWEIQATNRNSNLTTVYAGQMAAASWDLNCWFACQATLDS